MLPDHDVYSPGRRNTPDWLRSPAPPTRSGSRTPLRRLLRSRSLQPSPSPSYRGRHRLSSGFIVRCWCPCCSNTKLMSHFGSSPHRPETPARLSSPPPTTSGAGPTREPVLSGSSQPPSTTLSVEELLNMADAIPETGENTYVLLQMVRTCCAIIKQQNNRTSVLEKICF